MNRHMLLAMSALMGVLLVAATVRAQDRRQVPVAKASRPAAEQLTADQAYKANCTRCHAELPKLPSRGMKTVLMHMRVRGNIPPAQAQAILGYLTR